MRENQLTVARNCYVPHNAANMAQDFRAETAEALKILENATVSDRNPVRKFTKTDQRIMTILMKVDCQLVEALADIIVLQVKVTTGQLRDPSNG